MGEATPAWCSLCRRYLATTNIRCGTRALEETVNRIWACSCPFTSDWQSDVAVSSKFSRTITKTRPKQEVSLRNAQRRKSI